MKNIVGLVLALSFSSSLWAKDVCMVIINSSNGVATSGAQSCDGAEPEALNYGGTNTMQAVSGALSALYQDGLHLINCQVNQAGGANVEYICVVAR